MIPGNMLLDFDRSDASADARYRLLFERVPVALYRTAPDGALLDVNDALVRLLGYPTRAEFMRLNAADVYADAFDRHRWRELLERQGEARFEMLDRRYDGSLVWVRDTARVVRNDRGEPTCYEGMLEDITPQKDAEASLREGEERFRVLAGASDDVIWDWDLVTGEVVWNHALHRLFGYDSAGIGPGIERSWSWWLARIHPAERAAVGANFHQAVESGAANWHARYRFRRLNGSYADVLDRGYIGRDAAGQPRRLIGAMIDLARQPARAEARSTMPDRPPVPATSDATVVRWMARGEETALDELYDRHATMLFAITRSTGSSEADAEEIVGDVFLRAWLEAERFDVRRGSVTSWLTTMCRSRALERTRKRRRRDRLLKAALDQPDPVRPDVLRGSGPEITAENVATRTVVSSSLAALPAAQRQVLELAYFGGLTHAEIASRLDKPLGTVKTRIRSGLEAVRRHLEQVG